MTDGKNGGRIRIQSKKVQWKWGVSVCRYIGDTFLTSVIEGCRLFWIANSMCVMCIAALISRKIFSGRNVPLFSYKTIIENVTVLVICTSLAWFTTVFSLFMGHVHLGVVVIECRLRRHISSINRQCSRRWGERHLPFFYYPVVGNFFLVTCVPLVSGKLLIPARVQLRKCARTTCFPYINPMGFRFSLKSYLLVPPKWHIRALESIIIFVQGEWEIIEINAPKLMDY